MGLWQFWFSNHLGRDVLKAMAAERWPGRRISYEDCFADNRELYVSWNHFRSGCQTMLDVSFRDEDFPGHDELAQLAWAETMARRVGCHVLIPAWGATDRAFPSALVRVAPDGHRDLVREGYPDEDLEDCGLVFETPPVLDPWTLTTVRYEVWSTRSAPPRLVIVEWSRWGGRAFATPLPEDGTSLNHTEPGEEAENLTQWLEDEGYVRVGEVPGTYEVG